MKLVGKKSLIYWLRIPYTIYVIGFSLASLWILGLMGYYIITKNSNKFITIGEWENFSENHKNNEIVQFHYPFSKMVLATENTFEGIGIALLGLLTICFILYASLQLVNQFSKDNFFTYVAIKNLNILGFGMLILGTIYLIFDIANSPNRFDLTPPFFLAVIGIIILIIKEIFAKGKNIQEEIDLTI